MNITIYEIIAIASTVAAVCLFAIWWIWRN